MPAATVLATLLTIWTAETRAGGADPSHLPAVAGGWSIELAAKAPRFFTRRRSLRRPTELFTSALTRWTCPVRPRIRSTVS